MDEDNKKIDYMRTVKQGLFVCGIYRIKENWHISLKILYFTFRWFNITLAALGAIQNFLFVYNVEEFDLVSITAPFLSIAVYTGSTIRLLFFATSIDKGVKIMKEMNDNFQFKIVTPFGEKNIENYHSLVVKLVRFWQADLSFVASFMAVLPIIYMAKSGERYLPIKFYYPYKWDESPYFELTLVLQCYQQTMMGMSYTTTDSFFASVVILTTGQYSLLSEKLKNCVYTSLIKCGVDKTKVIKFKNIFNKYGQREIDLNEIKFVNDEEEDDLMMETIDVIRTKEFSDHFEKELIECVKVHQFLQEFLNHAQSFLSPVLFPVILLATYFLIFMAYGLLTDTNGMILSLLSQIIAVCIQLLIFTYFGQRLTDKYEEMFQSFYESPWYYCDTKCKKMFLFIQMSLVKPVIFRVGKIVNFQLPTFLSLIRSFMSYLTVLRQVEN